MTRESKKRAAAERAVDHVERGSLLGVGTGTTVNHFIEALDRRGTKLEGAVATSVETASRLRAIDVRLVDLNDVSELPLYIDGADEADRRGRLIKGGGGALTREKIVAAASVRFVCILDDSKLVERLGAFPLPLEVLPFAWRFVARAVGKLGGRARLREDVVTDNGNWILDVQGLDFGDPKALEDCLDRVPGVLTNGLFCRRPADLLLVAGAERVATIEVAGPRDRSSSAPR